MRRKEDASEGMSLTGTLKEESSLEGAQGAEQMPSPPLAVKHLGRGGRVLSIGKGCQVILRNILFKFNQGGGKDEAENMEKLTD